MQAERASDRDDQARDVGETLAAFYRAAAPAMRDLPVYNHALDFAAIGFRAHEEHAFGAIVTPWFMNLVRVPLDPGGDGLAPGAAVARALPAGALEFTVARLEGIGSIETCSLFSPMFGFTDQTSAEAAAAAALAAVLDPRFESAAATAEPGAPTPAREPSPLDRRRFLRGDLTERRP